MKNSFDFIKIYIWFLIFYKLNLVYVFMYDNDINIISMIFNKYYNNFIKKIFQ